MRLLTIAGLCVVLVACETANAPAQPRWTKRNVPGLSITLIDPVNVEYVGFGEHGMAVYTVGTRQLMTAPAGHWNIVGGKLCLYGDHEVIERLTLISSDGRTLTARSEMQSNKIVRFKILEGKV
jgi:hypothetical protein